MYRRPVYGQKAPSYNHLVAGAGGNKKDEPILNPMFTNPVLHEAMRIEDNEKLPSIK